MLLLVLSRSFSLSQLSSSWLRSRDVSGSRGLSLESTPVGEGLCDLDRLIGEVLLRRSIFNRSVHVPKVLQELGHLDLRVGGDDVSHFVLASGRRVNRDRRGGCGPQVVLREVPKLSWLAGGRGDARGGGGVAT